MAAFVLEVRGGHTATAYQLTTPEYRQRVTQSAFDATAASCGPGLGVGLVEAGFFAPDTGSTYSFDIWAGIAAGRETTVKVTAVRQGHHWLVDQFTVVIVTK